MAMKRLFELMAEKKASDIFISVGAPISIKINGNTIPVNQQIVKPDMVRPMMAEVLTERQLAEFDQNFELNTSIDPFRLILFRALVHLAADFHHPFGSQVLCSLDCRRARQYHGLHLA